MELLAPGLVLSISFGIFLIILLAGDSSEPGA